MSPVGGSPALRASRQVVGKCPILSQLAQFAKLAQRSCLGQHVASWRLSELCTHVASWWLSDLCTHVASWRLTCHMHDGSFRSFCLGQHVASWWLTCHARITAGCWQMSNIVTSCAVYRASTEKLPRPACRHFRAQRTVHACRHVRAQRTVHA